MRVLPGFTRQVVNQRPMSHRSVTEFAGVTKGDLLRAGPGYGKTHRIPVTTIREMGAGTGISQVAEGVNVSVVGRDFLTRCATRPAPSRAERQARRMLPRTIIHDLERHKKGASQTESPKRNVIVPRDTVI